MVFSGANLSQYFGRNDNLIKKSFEADKKNKLIEMDRNKYIDELVDMFSIKIPKINFDDYEIEISKKGNWDGGVDIGGRPTGHTIDVLSYKIPVEGDDLDLLDYKSSKFQLGLPETTTEDNFITFDIEKNQPKEEIEKTQKHSLSNLKANYEFFVAEIEEYNVNLRNKIEKIYDEYEKKISEDKELLEYLKKDSKKN
ncbi:MAG: hypothetical protein FGO69_10960 [Methanobacterium sp.]|nr:MAG: hypothetical protein FGO69_10960 [Methanobacterium sp.]